MKIEDRKTAMREAILSVPLTGRGYNDYVDDIVEKLTELGAFIPPVKIGETVFAAYPALDENDEDIIDEYKVRGYGVDKDGDLFILDEAQEINYFNTIWCNFTREDAEEWLRKGKRDE